MITGGFGYWEDFIALDKGFFRKDVGGAAVSQKDKIHCGGIKGDVRRQSERIP